MFSKCSCISDTTGWLAFITVEQRFQLIELFLIVFVCDETLVDPAIELSLPLQVVNEVLKVAADGYFAHYPSFVWFALEVVTIRGVLSISKHNLDRTV